jgi:lipoprotein-anchoring transpeptidase ErfK/SrfK
LATAKHSGHALDHAFGNGETPPARLLGLHDTWDVSSLGRASDTGRVRFRNADIEELCVLLRDGAAVAIVE